MGCYGENHVGSEENLVWVNKTHYPIFVIETEVRFKANRQICLVRNPIDSFVSYINLGITGGHSL